MTWPWRPRQTTSRSPRFLLDLALRGSTFEIGIEEHILSFKWRSTFRLYIEMLWTLEMECGFLTSNCAFGCGILEPKILTAEEIPGRIFGLNLLTDSIIDGIMVAEPYPFGMLSHHPSWNHLPSNWLQMPPM